MTTGTVTPQAEVPFGAIFSASWRLFRTNWTIALPPVIAGIVALGAFCVYLAALVAVVGIAGWRALFAATGNEATLPPSAVAALVGTGLIGGVVVVVLTVLLTLWCTTAMYGMADAAWTRGTCSFGDGFAAFRARAGAVFVAAIGVVLLAILALVLALPTLFLSIIALTLVTIFVMPAAVGGRFGGFDAIAESFRLVRRFFVPSLITWLVLYAIQYGISFLTAFAIVPLEMSSMPTTPNGPPVLPPLPLIGFSGVMYVVSIVLLLAYNGFRATVEVGLFRELEARRAADAVLLLPPGPAPAVPPTA